MKKGTVIGGLVLGMLFSGILTGWCQSGAKNQDYQYVLIEAVKQKNFGQLAEAVKLYTMVIKEKPDCDVAYFEIGSIYLMTNQLELARNNLAKAYELDPVSPIVNSVLAVRHAMRGEDEAAMRHVAIARELGAGVLPLAFVELFAQVRNGGYAAARASWERAMAALDKDVSWVEPAIAALEHR
ncbi:MAG: tetratricopeptide repeat protein, partial [Bacteroidia bacterium]